MPETRPLCRFSTLNFQCLQELCRCLDQWLMLFQNISEPRYCLINEIMQDLFDIACQHCLDSEQVPCQNTIMLLCIFLNATDTMPCRQCFACFLDSVPVPSQRTLEHQSVCQFAANMMLFQICYHGVLDLASVLAQSCLRLAHSVQANAESWPC